jgi:hypothetical protein
MIAIRTASSTAALRMPSTTSTTTPALASFPGYGIFEVGSQIAPGRYRAEGHGYWERLQADTGRFSDILANGNAEGVAHVEIRQTDRFFSTTNMGTWTRVA